MNSFWVFFPVLRWIRRLQQILRPFVRIRINCHWIRQSMIGRRWQDEIRPKGSRRKRKLECSLLCVVLVGIGVQQTAVKERSVEKVGDRIIVVSPIDLREAHLKLSQQLFCCCRGIGDRFSDAVGKPTIGEAHQGEQHHQSHTSDKPERLKGRALLPKQLAARRHTTSTETSPS